MEEKFVAYIDDPLSAQPIPLNDVSEEYLAKNDKRRRGSPEEYGLKRIDLGEFSFGSSFQFEISRTGDIRPEMLNGRFHKRIYTTCNCNNKNAGVHKEIFFECGDPIEVAMDCGDTCDWRENSTLDGYKWIPMNYRYNVDYKCNECKTLNTFFPMYDCAGPMELVTKHPEERYLISHAFLCPMCWEKMNPDNKEKENDSLTEKKRKPKIKKKNKIFRPNRFKQKKW